MLGFRVWGNVCSDVYLLVASRDGIAAWPSKWRLTWNPVFTGFR